MSRAVITHYRTDSGLGLRDPVRIVHLSDLHERNCDDMLPLIRQAAPDMIVVTGDTLERYDNRPQYDFVRKPVKKLIINIMHYSNYLLTKLLPQSKRPDLKNAHRFLYEISRLAPVYLSLGNHEQKLKDEDYAFLVKHGIVLLDNADTAVEIKGLRCTVGGMSSWDYEAWLPSFTAKSGYKLLLCHQPERYVHLLADSDINLTLAGHTHGGQIRIGKRGRGFFVPGQGLFGWYAHGSFFGGRLIVSAGCANTAACPRFFNPREVVVIDIE